MELYWETRFKQAQEAQRMLQGALEQKSGEAQQLRAASEAAAAERVAERAAEAAAQDARDAEVCDLRAAVAQLQREQQQQRAAAQAQAEVMQLAEEAAHAAADAQQQGDDDDGEDDDDDEEEEEEEEEGDAAEKTEALREALGDAQAEAEAATEMMAEAEAERDELRETLGAEAQNVATLRFLNEVLAQEMGEVTQRGKAKRAQLRARHERELGRIASDRAKEGRDTGTKIELMTGQLKEGLMKSLVKIRGLEADLAEARAASV